VVSIRDTGLRFPPWGIPRETTSRPVRNYLNPCSCFCFCVAMGLLGVAAAAAETYMEDECNGHGRCAHEACVCFPGWAGLGCDVCQDGTYGELCKLEGCAIAVTCEGKCDGESGACLANCAPTFSGVDCSVCSHGQQGEKSEETREKGRRMMKIPPSVLVFPSCRRFRIISRSCYPHLPFAFASTMYLKRILSLVLKRARDLSLALALVLALALARVLVESQNFWCGACILTPAYMCM